MSWPILFSYIAHHFHDVENVDMSELLRRQTRNLLGFACAGSNPAVDGLTIFFCHLFDLLKKISSSFFLFFILPHSVLHPQFVTRAPNDD